MATRNEVDFLDDAMDQVKDVNKKANSAASLILDIAKDRMDLDEDTPEEKLNELKEVMLELTELQSSISNLLNAYNSTLHQFKKSSELPSDIGNTVLENFKKMDSYDKRTLLNHKQYKQILDIIKQKNDSSRLRDVINDTEGDIIVTQQETVPLDPITKKEITDPVRNTICKHVYDRKSIVQHIASLKKNCKCPMLGCANVTPLTVGILEECEDIRRLIQRNRRNK